MIIHATITGFTVRVKPAKNEGDETVREATLTLKFDPEEWQVDWVRDDLMTGLPIEVALEEGVGRR